MNDIKRLLMLLVILGSSLSYAGNLAPYQMDEFGRIPLKQAIEKGDAAKVREILAIAPRSMFFTQKHGSTPFFDALILDDEAVLREIFKFLTYDELFNTKYGDHGSPLLVYAAAMGSENAVKILLEKGVPIEATDKDGLTACFQATRYRHHNVVELLLKHKANFNLEDKDGETGLSCYSSSGADSIPKLIEAAKAHGVKLTGKNQTIARRY